MERIGESDTEWKRVECGKVKKRGVEWGTSGAAAGYAVKYGRAQATHKQTSYDNTLYFKHRVHRPSSSTKKKHPSTMNPLL